MKKRALLFGFLLIFIGLNAQVKIEEGFEGVTLPALPADWTTIDQGTNNATWVTSDYNGGSGAHSGMQYVYLDTYDGSGTSADDYLITPQFTVSEGDELSYWVRCHGTYLDSVEVLASKTGTTVGDFTIVVDSANGPGDYTSYTVVLTDIDGIADGDQLYIAFRGFTGGSYTYIDDVRVGPPARTMQYAYAVNETSVDVVFDGDVYGDALVAANYQLTGTAAITFSTAEMDASDNSIVHLTGASVNMLTDQVLDTLVYMEDTAELYAGITPLSYIHTGNPDGLIEPKIATHQAIVTMIYGSNVYVADAAGAYNGAYPYGSSFAGAIEIGDEILFSGIYYYYNTNTSIGDLTLIETISTGNDPYPATVIAGADIDSSLAADTEPAEKWENVLVTVENAEVLSIDGYNFICTDDDGVSSFVVGSKFFDITAMDDPPAVGLTYNFTGLVEYRSSGGDQFYRMNPRDINDIEEIEVSLDKLNEGFEDAVIPDLPVGWLQIDGGTNNAPWISDDYAPHSGFQHMYLDTYDGEGTNADDYLISPQFTVNDVDELSFWALCNGSYPDSLIVLASKTGTTASDFTIVIDRMELTGDYEIYNYMLTENANIADEDQIYLAFYVNTGGSRVRLDDVRVGPPVRSMQYAYAVDETSVDVVFDGEVYGDALVAENYQLSGTAGISFTNAEIDATDNTLVHLTGALINMTADQILDTLVYLEDTAKFYAGVTPLAYIHTGNPAGLIEPEMATHKAIVTMIYGSNVYVADAAGAYNGAYPYGSSFADAINIGDEILFSGIYYYYNTNTSIGDLTLIETISTGNEPYEATLINGSDIDMTTAPDTEPAEKWENVLVKVNDAVVMEVNGYNFICTDDGGTTNFVVGSKFFDITAMENPPAPGEHYHFTGLVEYRSSGGDQFYRMNPRDPDDLEFIETIVMEHAYSVSETAVDAVFSGEITGDAALVSNYNLSGTADITFTTAEIDANDNTILHLTGASANMASDQIKDRLTFMGTGVDFYAGITPLAYIHTGNPDGLIDAEMATFKAIVTMIYGSNVYVADAAGAYNGAYPYGSSFAEAISIGDEIVFSGIYYYYNTNTSIGDLTLIEIVTTGNEPYEKTEIPGSDIDMTIEPDTEPAEKWENVLVEVLDAEVLSVDGYNFICSDDGGTTSFVVGSKFVDLTALSNPPEIGTSYDFTGLVEYRSSGDDNFYRLNPRDSADVKLADAVDEQKRLALSFFPNPFNEIIYLQHAAEIIEIEVYNITGQKVHYQINQNHETVRLNLSELDRGIYFLKAIHMDGRHAGQKIIKQ